jgi:hypothetical protein
MSRNKIIVLKILNEFRITFYIEDVQINCSSNLTSVHIGHTQSLHDMKLKSNSFHF